MEYEYELIHSQYSKEFTRNTFEEDYSLLHFKLFNARIMTLTGPIENIIKARAILLGENKADKEEKKWARKFMTPSIEAYLKNVDLEKDINKVQSIFQSAELMASKKSDSFLSEKRLQEKNKRIQNQFLNSMKGVNNNGNN
jgi:hypothetical protein